MAIGVLSAISKIRSQFEMHKLFIIQFFIFCSFSSYAQTYYIGNDSVSFVINCISQKDSLDAFKIKIQNNSFSNIYFGNETEFKKQVFISKFGNSLLVHCGGTFSEPFDRSIDNLKVELQTIKAKDSIVLYIQLPDLEFPPKRKLTLLEFAKMNRSFWLDYIDDEKIPLQYGLFIDFKKYMQLKKRILCQIHPF